MRGRFSNDGRSTQPEALENLGGAPALFSYGKIHLAVNPMKFLLRGTHLRHSLRQHG
jgi:hypothetical protein